MASRRQFGVKDPQFHRDISFFAWDYPVYRLMLGFGFTAVIFSLVFSVAVHYLSGAIRLQTPGPKITLSARRHLTILIFLFIVFKAIAYWLDRYGLVYSDRGKVTGASYTDVNASLPAKTILFWIAVIIAVAVLASLWLKSARLPAIGFVVLLDPEHPDQRHLSGDRAAGDGQAERQRQGRALHHPKYSGDARGLRDPDGGGRRRRNRHLRQQLLEIRDARRERPRSARPTPTITDIRILDPNIVVADFHPAAADARTSTAFPTSSTSTGTPSTVRLGTTSSAVRELKAANLRGDQTNWINQHTVYTHGYGFVAAQGERKCQHQG